MAELMQLFVLLQEIHIVVTGASDALVDELFASLVVDAVFAFLNRYEVPAAPSASELVY